MRLTSKAKKTNAALEDLLKDKITEADTISKTIDDRINKSINDTYWPLLFTAMVSILIGTYAVDRGYIYELDSAPMQGENKINWRLNDLPIVRQVDNGDLSSNRIMLPTGSKLEKRADISKAGVLNLRLMREADQGVYSCETVKSSVLGYEGIDQIRWFKVKVVKLSKERMAAMVTIVSSIVFGSITLLVSLVEHVYDDGMRILFKVKDAGESTSSTSVESSDDVPKKSIRRRKSKTMITRSKSKLPTHRKRS